MADAAPKRMTADEFIAWAMEQPSGRYELHAGQVVAMAPERVSHARVKAETWLALRTAIREAGLPCQAFVDGVAVRVDAETIYEPDALVRCGPPAPDDATEIGDPIVVVEVISRSSRAADTGAKLVGYFRVPTVRHYLIVQTEPPVVVHHARGPDGAIATTIRTEGELVLDPPGLTVPVAAFFARG